MFLNHARLVEIAKEAAETACQADQAGDVAGGLLARELLRAAGALDRYSERRGFPLVPEPADLRGLAR